MLEPKCKLVCLLFKEVFQVKLCSRHTASKIIQLFQSAIIKAAKLYSLQVMSSKNQNSQDPNQRQHPITKTQSYHTFKQ